MAWMSQAQEMDTVQTSPIVVDGTMFITKPPNVVEALDAGAVRCDVSMADPKLGYSGTGAPLAVKDKIIVGMAGGEFGVRGFIDAYDAKTGKCAPMPLTFTSPRRSRWNG